MAKGDSKGSRRKRPGGPRRRNRKTIMFPPQTLEWNAARRIGARPLARFRLPRSGRPVESKGSLRPSNRKLTEEHAGRCLLNHMSSIQVPETVTAQPSARAGGWIWALVITCVLLWVSMHARIGWDAPITEAHAWRQTQTAISAYYLVGQPFHLAYETPTLGPPWSVPMEFPFYQLAVARLVDLTGLELVPAGRLVGLFCFFATAFPLWYIASLLSGSRTLAIGAAALFLSSAYYAFWSRTFMIESLSLLLGVSFLAAFMIAWNGKSWRWAGVATTLGALAGLAKVTTFALFMAAAVLYLFSTRWRDWQRRLSSEGAARTLGSILRESVFPLVILSGAIAVAVWWVSFSDQVKREHPLGAEMASKAMTHWNFGTLAQKTDLQTWKLIAGRSLAAVGERIPALALLLLSGAAVWRSRRYRGAFLGCLFLCGLGPVVFTNLYYVHDYYYNGNLIFALGAVW